MHNLENHLVDYKEGLKKYEKYMLELVQTFHEYTEHCFRGGENSLKNK
ncbi:hypothetical protein [Virgibacillus siamensis]|nr:hypothetical protein [Virgibacillus siamensis]